MVMVVLYVWWSDSRMIASSRAGAATATPPRTNALSPSSPHDIPDKNETSTSLTRWPFGNASDMRLQFIHVGKAGGMSLRESLPIAQRGQVLEACRRRHLEEEDKHSSIRRHWIEACDVPLPSDESPMLAQRMFAFQHMCCGHAGFEWLPEETPDQPTQTAAMLLNLLVFTVRDPVDRLVSTFNYQHQMNFAGKPALPGEQDTLRTPRALVYLQCFPTVEDLARTVDPRQPLQPSADAKTTACRTVGNQLLNGTFNKPKFDHFTYNYQSYADRYWPQRRQAVAVVRMEEQWRDVARLEGLIGGDPGRFSDVAQSTTRVSHGSEGFALQGGVSPEGAIGLCCAAWTELQVYQQLIVAAVNLNVREKRDTLLALHVHCGQTAAEQSSWGELEAFTWESWYAQVCRPGP
jgi:hypothetical protein